MNNMTDEMTVHIARTRVEAIIPTRGSEKAAGYDLYACTGGKEKEPVTIRPHETAMIGTGIAIAIPDGCFGAIFARSGLAAKQGLRPANAVGVIDSDYRGEVKVALHNDTEEPQTILNGQRIAQLVIIPYAVCALNVVESLDATTRGTGGFGSTGSM